MESLWTARQSGRRPVDGDPRADPVPIVVGMTLISYTDWYATGGTRGDLTRALAAGAVQKIRRGMLLTGRKPPNPQAQHLAQVRAAARALNETTFVDRTSAAVVHELPVFASRLERVTVLRTGGGHGVIRPLIHARSGAVDATDVLIVDGVPVTSLARTVADLARQLPFTEAVMTLDAALRLGAKQDDIFARLEGVLGCRRAARAVAFADARAESPGESISRAVMHLAGLPAPELQHVVCSADGEFLGRLDFYWDEAGLGGEFDGRIKYTELANGGSDAGTVIWGEKRRELAVGDQITAMTRWVWPEMWNGVMCHRVARKLGVTNYRVPTLLLPRGVG